MAVTAIYHPRTSVMFPDQYRKFFLAFAAGDSHFSTVAIAIQTVLLGHSFPPYR